MGRAAELSEKLPFFLQDFPARTVKVNEAMRQMPQPLVENIKKLNL
jgi:hypothetical protein